MSNSPSCFAIIHEKVSSLIEIAGRNVQMPNSRSICVSAKRRRRVPVAAGPSGPRPVAAARPGGRAQEAAGVRGVRQREEGAGEGPEQFRSAQSESRQDAFRSHWIRLDLYNYVSQTQWYAICLSDVGDYEGVKVKIGNSYIIRDHLEVSVNARFEFHVGLLATSTS